VIRLLTCAGCSLGTSSSRVEQPCSPRLRPSDSRSRLPQAGSRRGGEARCPTLDSCELAATWARPVVTADLFAQDEPQLRAEVLRLERRVQVLLSIVRLLLVPVRLSGYRLDSLRVPASETKATILSAIARAKRTDSLAIALRVLGLSASRYHAWRRLNQVCALGDRSSCPRTVPTQLTADETSAIREMVTSEEYRHMPIGTLALYASERRKGVCFARHLGATDP